MSGSIHKLKNKIGSPFKTEMIHWFNKYVLNVGLYAMNCSGPSHGEKQKMILWVSEKAACRYQWSEGNEIGWCDSRLGEKRL